MQTHDLGRVFTHAISLDPKSKRLHTAPTHEVDSPYRWSNSLVVRVWRSYGFVLGWWRNTQRTEEQALLAALQAHTDVDLLDDEGYLREEFERGYVDV
jgi:hypothetical protein